MTTIDLPPELERVLRPWKGTNPDLFTQSDNTVSRIANLLPDPPYVPEVGDYVRVFRLDNGDESTLESTPEDVVAVTDIHVITLYKKNVEQRELTAFAYRIDAHRFERVEK